jgi:hypothetical protein
MYRRTVMKMSKVASAASVLFLVLASLSQAVFASNDDPCIKHYAVKGGFFTGKTYSTWQEFPSVSKLIAFKQAYVYVVKDGWKIDQGDKDMGIISPSKSVGSQSETLNVLIEDLHQGCKVTLTHMTPGGTSATKNEIQTEFCGLMGEVGKQGEAK